MDDCGPDEVRGTTPNQGNAHEGAWNWTGLVGPRYDRSAINSCMDAPRCARVFFFDGRLVGCGHVFGPRWTPWTTAAQMKSAEQLPIRATRMRALGIGRVWLVPGTTGLLSTHVWTLPGAQGFSS